MSKLYLFAIGGTGSRVVRSLTMLLASGVKCDREIVPIFIDPDSQNGDLLRAVKDLRLYEDIHSALATANGKNQFFRTSIGSLNNAGDYLIPLNSSGIKFSDYLNVNAMAVENQALTKALFTDKNLADDMNVGFKGNPNVGTVVLNQFSNSKIFADFEQNFSGGDEIFIVSSIFGGTGASGFPLLLKKFRNSRSQALSTARIGALSLLPYFILQTDPQSSIDSTSFVSKAKAALSYYEANVTGNCTLDDMYYLGDDLRNNGYQNVEGGNKQTNDAHFLEFLGALSIIDFSRKPSVRQNLAQPNQPMPAIETSFHEYALKTDGTNNALTFDDLDEDTITLIRKPMIQMALMFAFLSKHDVGYRISRPYGKMRKNRLGKVFYDSPFFKDGLAPFLWEMGGDSDASYQSWIRELGRNEIKFKPFYEVNYAKDILGIAQNLEPNYSPFAWLKKKGDIKMDKELCEDFAWKVDKNMSAAQQFMELFYITTEKLCTKILHI